MSQVRDNDGNGILKSGITIMEEEEEEEEEKGEMMMDEIKNLKEQLCEKIYENENYKQELYELRQKLKASVATQKDLLESNEMIEENLNKEKLLAEKKISNLLEKFSTSKKNYEERLTELQSGINSVEKKNYDLKEALSIKEKQLIASKSDNPEKNEDVAILKNKIHSMGKELEERCNIEIELLSTQRKLEETIASMQKNYNEVNDILELKKAELVSVNETLEETRNELVLCRSEIDSLKATPASDCAKGNSLFAEVDDSRRELIQDMTSLRKKYIHMKQTYEAKDRELKTLKVERALLLRKWDDDNVENVNHSAQLIESYKSRIWELEEKLKVAEKKLKIKEDDKKPADNSFGYLQSLLTAKKKEIEELHKKLSEFSVEKILQEEVKYEISKQLRQWRYKAMSYQAQLMVMRNQTEDENDPKIKLEDSEDPKLSNDVNYSDEKTRENISPIVEETDPLETTLDKLLRIPTLTKEDNNKKDSDIFYDTRDIDLPKLKRAEIIEQEDLTSIENIPASPKPKVFEKLTTKDCGGSDKENSASTSNNVKTKTLKPTLVKSEAKKSVSKIQEKTQKNLRFTSDTVDNQKPKLNRQKVEKKAHPVVFISNQSKK